MALQAVVGDFLFPQVIPFATNVPAYTSMLLDASGEKAAFVFRIPKTGTLDKFEFRLGTVTQAPASGLKCSFQDVSLTTGDPDGTVDQSRVVTAGLTSNTWVAPGLITSDGTDTGVKRAVTAGDLIACVIEFEAFGAGDSLNISRLDTALIEFPYSDQFQAAWAKNSDNAICALKYNDGTYVAVNLVYPFSALNMRTFNNGSTPDEVGILVRFPFPVTIVGAWVRLDLDGDADVVLYDSDGTTVLASNSLDTNVRASAAGGTFTATWAPVSLLKDTDYRLVMKPTTVTNISMYDFDVSAAAIMDAIDGGQGWHHTQRTDAGAWSQTTTKRSAMGVAVQSADDAAGGGIRLAGHGGLAA